MIVASTRDDASDPEPGLGFAMRVGLLTMVGLVAAGALTARVRLHVLQAEQRRLAHEIADMKAVTELMRCQVTRRSAPADVLAYARSERLGPPAAIADIGPPTVARGQAAHNCPHVRAGLRELSRTVAENTAHRLAAVLRGPPAGK
jgi:hypothetical protein